MKERKIQIALGVGAGNRLGLIVAARLPTFLSLALPSKMEPLVAIHPQNAKREQRLSRSSAAMRALPYSVTCIMRV